MNTRCSAYLLMILLLLLAGCGGGTDTLSGVAAAGAPIVGTVYLKDSANPAAELSVPITANGSFSFAVGSMTPPFLLKAVGSANGNDLILYSLASSPGVAHINPLTNLAVVEAADGLLVPISSAPPVPSCACHSWASRQAGNSIEPAPNTKGSGWSLNDFYANPSPDIMNKMTAGLPDAVSSVSTVLQPTLAKLGLKNPDFFGGRFHINHQGLDLLFDLVDIGADNASRTVSIYDRTAGISRQMSIDEFKSSSVDVITVPIPAAGSVCIWPSTRVVDTFRDATFSAVVVGDSNSQVVWSVDEAGGGTISSDGTYHAPGIPGIYHVRATSASDAGKSTVVTADVRWMNGLSFTKIASAAYDLQAIDFKNVSWCIIDIRYDSNAFANPLVTPGAFAAGTVLEILTNNPGLMVMRISAIPAIKPRLTGSGSLATIAFDTLGAALGTAWLQSYSLAFVSGPYDTQFRAMPAGVYQPGFEYTILTLK